MKPISVMAGCEDVPVVLFASVRSLRRPIRREAGPRTMSQRQVRAVQTMGQRHMSTQSQVKLVAPGTRPRSPIRGGDHKPRSCWDREPSRTQSVDGSSIHNLETASPLLHARYATALTPLRIRSSVVCSPLQNWLTKRPTTTTIYTLRQRRTLSPPAKLAGSAMSMPLNPLPLSERAALRDFGIYHCFDDYAPYPLSHSRALHSSH